MSFEDDVRTTLQSQASDIDLRGRGATEVMHLARRRQHRARRAGAVAAVGVLGVGAIGVLTVRNRASEVTVDSAAEAPGLTPLGPLDLSWQSTGDGLSGGPIFTEDASGVIYALSTAPGTRYSDDGIPPESMLYRLADDGSWQPAAGVGASPRLTDLASDGAVLYALSTGPGTGGAGYDTHLSSSTDGGQTWTDASVLPVHPPSSAVAWTAHSTMQIESSPFGEAIAVVSTGFSAPWSLATAEADALGISTDEVGLEVTDAGVEVVHYDRESWGAEVEAQEKQRSGATESGAPGSTTPPTTSAPPAAPDPVAPPTSGPSRPASTVLRTYSWAELGVSGPDAVRATATVLVRQDGGWVQVDASGLAGLSIESVDVIGPDFVARGWVYDATDETAVPTLRTMASSDGQSWRLVADDAGRGSSTRIVGVGTAWVSATADDGSGTSRMQVSVDRGATWQGIDLGSVDGRLVGGDVIAVDGGPLGLAAVVQTNGGSTGYLLTTRDLLEWTVTPLAELSDGFASTAGVGPALVVGADRIVLTATIPQGDDVEGRLDQSVTLIGTPTR